MYFSAQSNRWANFRIWIGTNHGSSHGAYLEGNFLMLYTIAVVLVILWLLGVATSYTMGGVIHILLVIALISVLLRVIRGG
jgi:hypothetical protein